MDAWTIFWLAFAIIMVWTLRGLIWLALLAILGGAAAALGVIVGGVGIAIEEWQYRRREKKNMK